MNVIKHYSIQEKFRLFLVTIIYIIFCLYTINLITNEQNFYAKLVFLAIMIIFISISIWSEYLRFLYQSAILTLNINLDPKTSLKIFEKLNKKDFFKSYSKTFLIFKILHNMSIKNYTECLKILDENNKFFRSSLDNLLIQKYTYFFCYYKLHDIKKIEKYYRDLQKFRTSKIKKGRLSPLYNWDFIDGIYFKAIYNLKQSKHFFENTNTTNMNNLELLYYFSEYEDLLLKLNLNEQDKKIKYKIKKIKEGDYFENKQKNN